MFPSCPGMIGIVARARDGWKLKYAFAILRRESLPESTCT